jgi:hypothetical protein
LPRNHLSRYERDEAGNIIIDVYARRVEDLYNDFDKSAPYVRRDLDQDLVDHVIGCARELGASPFVLRFTLENPPDDQRFARVRRSVHDYFLYLTGTEKRKILQMFRRSAILFVIGLGLLFVSVSFNGLLGTERSVTMNVLAEGLTVASWVSLWEAIAIFLIGWFPHRRNILIYQRFVGAGVVFRSSSQMVSARTDPLSSGQGQGTGEGPPTDSEAATDRTGNQGVGGKEERPNR